MSAIQVWLLDVSFMWSLRIFMPVFPIVTFIVLGSMGLYDCTCLRSCNFNNCCLNNQTGRMEGGGWYVECTFVPIKMCVPVFWVNTNWWLWNIQDLWIWTAVLHMLCMMRNPNKKCSLSGWNDLKGPGLQKCAIWWTLQHSGQRVPWLSCLQVKDQVRENNCCFVFNIKQAFVTPLWVWPTLFPRKNHTTNLQKGQRKCCHDVNKILW